MVSRAWTIGVLCIWLTANTQEQQVQRILATYCLTCHGPDTAEAGISQINDLNLLIADGWVIPGDLNASILWQDIDPRDPVMPPPGYPALPVESAEVIRQWIAGATLNDLGGNPEPQPTYNRTQDYQLITEDLAKHPEHKYFTWFDTYQYFYEQGKADKIYQLSHGIFQVLNSLSWSKDMVEPKFLNTTGTVAVIDLDKFTPFDPTVSRDKLWQQLLADCQSAPALPAVDMTCFMNKLVQSPQVYYRWLGLPPTEPAIWQRLNLDLRQNLTDTLSGRADQPVLRIAATADETFAPLPRLFERHPLPDGGYYWRSYELQAQTNEAQDFFKRPLVLEAAWTLPKLAYEFEFTESFFSLPNGLQAYIVVDRDGRLLPRAPDQTITYSSGTVHKPGLPAGFHCGGCHWNGVVDPRISRRRQSADSAFNLFWREHGPNAFGVKPANHKLLHRILEKLYADPTTVTDRVQKDQERFQQTNGSIMLESPVVSPQANGIIDWLQLTDAFD